MQTMHLRLFGLAAIVAGIAGWWYNWHLADTAGYFYVKLCIFGPLAIGGGLMMIVRPDWAGPVRSDSTRSQKVALGSLIAFMAIASGIDFYLLKTPPRPQRVLTPPQPPRVNITRAGMPKSPLSPIPSLEFMAQRYLLGSFNQRHNAMWEFVSAGETVENWTTLLTIVDRPDARTTVDLDRLAEGLMSNYKARGARVLAAKTSRDNSGAAFNYLVVAFEEAASHRFELNFVKVTMGARNAAVVIYGARISDPQDYRSKAKEFLDRKPGEIGAALSEFALPDIARLPRRTF